MTRKSAISTISVITACAALGANPARADGGLTILVWSDLHGKVPSGLNVVVDSARAAAAASRSGLLALDAGDAFFGSRLAHITSGVSMVAEINFLRPDAMILGYNDFSWNRGRLDSLMSAISDTIKIVSTNLRRNVDDQALGGHRSLILTTGGHKVGLVGIADPELANTARPERMGDIRIDDEADATTREVEVLRKAGASPVIVVAHAGDESVAKLAKIPGVDLVLQSHDLDAPGLKPIGAGWIAQVPSGSASVLRIDLDSADSKWTARQSSIPMPRTTSLNAAWKEMDRSHEQMLRDVQDREVGTLKAAWPVTRREGLLGNWVADAFRGVTNSDLGLVPSTWIRKGLPKGKVRVSDIWNIVPPSEELVSIFNLPASDVMKLLERQMRRSKDFLFISGLTCTPDSSMYGGSPISVKVNGKPIDRSAYFKIAVPQDLRDDIYELTGISEESAGLTYTDKWEADVLIEWGKTHGLATDVGRVPAMYGGTAPR